MVWGPPQLETFGPTENFVVPNIQGYGIILIRVNAFHIWVDTTHVHQSPLDNKGATGKIIELPFLTAQMYSTTSDADKKPTLTLKAKTNPKPNPNPSHREA